MTEETYKSEFERAMRGCRRLVEEARQARKQHTQGETNEPVWSDVPASSVGELGE